MGTEDEDQTVLRRKAAGGREGSGPAPGGGRRVPPAKALSMAVARACEERLSMPARVAACTTRLGSLAELLDMLPERGLYMVIEGPADAQGLFVLDSDLLSAVIEKQMTGQVGKRPPPARRPTRTDAALTADLVDGILREAETPFIGREEARWIGGFGYANYLDEPRPLALMMEEEDYRIFTLAVEVELGAREGTAIVALPAEGRGRLDGQPLSPEDEITDDTDANSQALTEWRNRLEERVMIGDVPLEAVLFRLKLPLSRLRGLVPGQELTMPASAIDETELSAIDGSIVAVGRLGQSAGMRALRLNGTPAAKEAGTMPAAADIPNQLTDDPGAAAAPAMTDLPDLPGGPNINLPAAPPMDIEVSALPTEPSLPDLPELPDVDLDGLPDLSDSGGLPDLPDLADLPDLPDLSTGGGMQGLPPLD